MIGRIQEKENLLLLGRMPRALKEVAHISKKKQSAPKKVSINRQNPTLRFSCLKRFCEAIVGLWTQLRKHLLLYSTYKLPCCGHSNPFARANRKPPVKKTHPPPKKYFLLGAISWKLICMLILICWCKIYTHAIILNN